MRNFIFGFLFLFLVLNCQVDIKQIPPSKQDSVSSIAKYPNQVYIGKFDIITYDRLGFVNGWKPVFIEYLKSARIFSKVSVPDNSSKITPDDYALDITITPKYSDTYNYWWTWPAIYPMVAYWPVQIRETSYKVQCEYTLYKGAKLIATNTILEEADLTVEIYGFFRTGNVEKMIESTNLQVMDRTLRDIEGKLLSTQN